jgi:hypothetical protein
MNKREPRFNVEAAGMVEIDEDLDAAIEEAIASSARGEAIPWEVFRKELFDEV